MPPRGADDPELELARGDPLDDRLRVGDGERDPDARVLALELAEQQRHDDCCRPRRGADLQLARQLALALAGDLVEDLALERQQPLGAAVEPQTCLRRLDAAAGAVEQLRAEPLLERPHLQRDRRLRDAETLRRLREAAPLDDRAERSELTSVHKEILYSHQVRVWVDITNSPHVPFFRPLLRLLQEDGHEVEVTARAYAQTLELLDLHGIAHQVVGPAHGGAGSLGKARAMAGRLPALRSFAKSRRFDVALAHGSHEAMLVARSLGVPGATAHDYEFASLQHQLGLRAARRVVFPDAVPPERLARFGVRPPKLVQFPGLEEEYYLADFEPDRSVLEGITAGRVVAVVRTPPEISLYHRHDNPLFREVLERLGKDESVYAIVLPRTQEQREAINRLGLPSLHVPKRAVDAQSLVALADLVVSAGGTMNREAVALGTPVYTTFAGRLGAVDESLIRSGRLRPLTAAADLDVRKREPSEAARERRDPRVLLELLLSA